MPMRAYKIEHISLKSTFELVCEGTLWTILEQAKLVKDIGESGGIISFDEDDLKEIERILSESSNEIPAEEVAEIAQILDEIRQELDPKWQYVFYHCY